MHNSIVSDTTRKGLLGLILEETRGGGVPPLRIKKLNTTNIKSHNNTVAFKKPTQQQSGIINLQRLSTIESKLTNDTTIHESPMVNPTEESYKSYKYLKELSEKVKNLFFRRDKKTFKTVKLTAGSLVDGNAAFKRSSVKRHSVKETSGMSFLKLIPCLKNDGFKIDLIECEKN
jgi:hypothetical protein